MYGNIQKYLVCPCAVLGYSQTALNSQMTAPKYKMGLSRRVLVAQETLVNKYRQKLPVLVLNLDGVIGHWDESKTFNIRQKTFMYLAALTCNFRIIAFATSQTKGVVTRLC